MDDRESECGIPEMLRKTASVSVSMQRLPLGDYLVDQKLLVERKTFKDFVSSIKDGRLFHQASRLASHPLRSAILLEGTTDDLRQIHMRRESIQGALIALTIVYGIPVLRSIDPEESSRLLLYAANQVRTRQLRPLPRQGKRPRGKTKLQLHILQGLPGVGPDRAAHLLETFGSIEAVVTAQAEHLAEVPNIGIQTARVIRWSVSR
ncbi:MAG: ERCC4 domain-containing protein [Ignavibacteria bacterium]|nr:ERCC4 domain-containing protein [Ignavibacteria bacterium]